MPAPIIDPTTSVLGYRVGTRWNYQPATTNAPAPTSWACTGLPAGISFGTATGLISGAATEEGVFLARLTATNGDGTSSPFILTIGIFEKLWREFGAHPLNVDLRSQRVYPHGVPTWEPGDPVMFAKSGDKVVVDVGWTADGGETTIPMQPHLLRVGIKESDLRAPLWISTGTYETMQSDTNTRYRIVLDFTGPKVARMLRDYESDTNTYADVLAEIELVQLIEVAGEVTTLRKTSQHFRIRTAKEIIPNA